MITRPRRCGRDHYYYASCVTPGPCVYASTVYARPHGYWPTGAEREGKGERGGSGEMYAGERRGGGRCRGGHRYRDVL